MTTFTDIVALAFKNVYNETSVKSMEFTFWCDLFNGGVSFITAA